jgi:hypothetical protein
MPEFDDMDFPRAFGVSVHSMSSKEFAFALFYHDFRDQTLVFLRLRADTPEQFQALVGAAAKHAHAYHIKRILVWDLAPKLVSGTPWKVEPRTSSLPMIALYDKTQASKWKQQEHYAWC